MTTDILYFTGDKVEIPAVKLSESGSLHVNMRFSVKLNKNRRFRGSVDKNKKFSEIFCYLEW
jgi:hypothetical protein